MPDPHLRSPGSCPAPAGSCTRYATTPLLLQRSVRCSLWEGVPSDCPVPVYSTFARASICPSLAVRWPGTPSSPTRAPSTLTLVPKPVLQVPGRWRQHLQPCRRCRSLRGGPRRVGLGPGPRAFLPSLWRSQLPQRNPKGLGPPWAAKVSRCQMTRTSVASGQSVRPKWAGT